MATTMCRFFPRSHFLKHSSRASLLRQTNRLFSLRGPRITSRTENIKNSWLCLGSFVIGGLLGFQLYGYSHRRRTNIWDDLIANTTYCVNARSIDTSGDNSLPPSKRFNFIADAVEAVAPAVVYIEVTDSRAAGIFGHPSGPTSSGSGFIVSEDGMVLTNAHVVANAVDVNVKLTDGRTFKGVVVDLDPVTDLAAIKLNASQGMTFSTIKFGVSKSLRPGEWVVALGSPLTLSNTITAGIVSTVHRGGKEIGLPNQDMEYIQTDAAINVGNSGGPLVNLDGEVIGISAITVQFAAGISFAIPIDKAKEFLKGVMEKKNNKNFKSSSKQRTLGPLQRWYIGMNMLTLSPPILEELQRRDSNFNTVRGGVLVAGINHKSPAHVGGVRHGDVITKINGKSISTAKEVFDCVKRGETLNMEVQRANKIFLLAVQPQVVGRQ